MRLLPIFGSIALIAAAGVWLSFHAQHRAPHRQAAHETVVLELASTERSPQPAPATGSPHPVAPKVGDISRMPPSRLPSLRDTDVPDSLHEDENGHLIIDADLRLLFDYFQLAQTDVGDEELQRIVTEWIQKNAIQHTAENALDIWQRYRNYQSALTDHPDASLPETQETTLDTEFLSRFKTALEQRKTLQQQWLPDAAESWFADENAYDSAMLDKLQNALEHPVADQKITAIVRPQELNLEYEQQLAQLRQNQGIDDSDRKSQEHQLRQQFFPDRQAYIRQSLRDLSYSPH